MLIRALAQAIECAPAPDRVRKGFKSLLATNAAAALQKASPEHARIIAGLFSGSHAMGNRLLAHPDWVKAVLLPEYLEYPRLEQGLRREVNAWLQPALQARNYEAALAKLRQFKQRELLRIAARDLARFGDAPQITLELSNVAD